MVPWQASRELRKRKQQVSKDSGLWLWNGVCKQYNFKKQIPIRKISLSRWFQRDA